MSQRLEHVYTPSTRPRGFTWSGFSPRAYVDLLLGLVRAQIKIRYDYAALGLGWAILNPLLQMIVYAFVFGAIFSTDQANFRLFLLAGLLPWHAFSQALTACVSSLVNQSDLLKKAPFPSELLPISAVLNSMFTLLITFAIFIVYLAIRGFPVFSAMHWVLLALVVQTAFLSGLALLVSCLNVFFRDVEHLMSFAIWIWFFLTPIIYPLERLSEARGDLLVHLNPMAGVVRTMQTGLLEGKLERPSALLVAGVIAVVVLSGGWLVFRRFQYELPKVA